MTKRHLGFTFNKLQQSDKCQHCFVCVINHNCGHTHTHALIFGHRAQLQLILDEVRKTHNCHLDWIKSNQIRCEWNTDHANNQFSFTRQVNRQFNNLRLIWSKHNCFHLKYWLLEYMIIKRTVIVKRKVQN